MPRQASKPSIPLEQVPGVGIIRARSLRKAGVADLAALSRATVEQIAAIPGISPQKAQQLVDYARGNGAKPAAPPAAAGPAGETAPRRRGRPPAASKTPATPARRGHPPAAAKTDAAPARRGRPPAAPRADAQPVRRRRAQLTSDQTDVPAARRTRRAGPRSAPAVAAAPPPRVIVTPPSVPAVVSAPPPKQESELSALARRISQSASELLRSPEAAAFRRSLSRQLGKVASFADSLIDYDMAEKAASRARAQLGKMEDAISRAAAATKRTVQNEIAGELRTRRRKTARRVSPARSSGKRG